MTLETLQKEMIAAMKSGDKTRKEVLSNIIGAIKKAAIDKKCKDNIPDSLVDETILKEKKIIQEMIDTCPESRVETLNEYKTKMAVVSEYAPVLMTSADEIRAFVQSEGLEFTKENRGAIMRLLKGRADMKVASSLF